MVVKSREFTNLLKVSRSEFLKVLKDHDRDNERFCHIKDCLQYSNDFNKIGLKCYSCESKYHTIDLCPLLQPKRNKKIIYHKHIHSFDQIRNIVDKPKRYRLKFYHALLNNL